MLPLLRRGLNPSSVATLLPRPRIRSFNTMTDERASLSHEERTAAQPRENAIEEVELRDLRQINESIRLMRLYSAERQHHIKFLPGQWLDVFVPGLSRAGGFTITSTPKDAQPTTDKPGYLELAIQNSSNPPAKWLWRPESEILRQILRVRVGGSFTWPPPHIASGRVNRLVLIAGGVGINPLISIFTHLIRSESRPDEIVFLYGTKATGSPIDAEKILFVPRLKELKEHAASSKVQVKLFLTHASDDDVSKAIGLPGGAVAGRITQRDLEASLGDVGARADTVCYVCGPPKMTDSFVDHLSTREGMTEDRVLCEKWW